MKDSTGLSIGVSAFVGIVGGLAVSGLVLAGLGLLDLGIKGGGVTTSAAFPVQYKIEITHNGSTCQFNTTWKDRWGFGHSSSNGWVTISESNNDTVAWVHSGGTDASYTVNFPPVRSSAFPGTPFFDYSTGNWINKYGSSTSPVPSSVVTLTPAESSAGVVRFPYDFVQFNDDPTHPTRCQFPGQGMGIQITK